MLNLLSPTGSDVLGHFESRLGLADMYGIYKSNEPLLIKKTSFEVKHCKIETVFILKSAQADRLKKTYI